jgi:hypothetical protein
MTSQFADSQLSPMQAGSDLYSSNRRRVNSTFKFEDPWEAAEQPDKLQAQLEEELLEGHPLFGELVKVLAARVDSDDILVQTRQGYALVHTSWCRRSKPTLPFPHTVLFQDWDRFLEQVYYPDRSEWEGDDDGWDEIIP